MSGGEFYVILNHVDLIYYVLREKRYVQHTGL